MDKINVTRPFLPPLDEFQPYLEQIWENKWLTNNGPFHQQFEKELAEFLGVPYISLFVNGTLALVTALQALNITGEVITTPYTFVATSHALVWNKLKPVFVDVDPVYGNIDPNKIVEAITDKTSAILPVHVYGNPCQTEAIKKIADDYNLKVIYDAAHAFGVQKDGQSILNSGELSILSFHATKVFNTFEGGAIVCHSMKMKQHIDDLKNFGFRDETIVVAAGINAKMNEIQAAMGLLQLKYIQGAIDQRKKILKEYLLRINKVKGIEVLPIAKDIIWNYCYFPIFVNENYSKSRDELYNDLKKIGMNVRRYFYPLITEFEPYNNDISRYQGKLIVATKLSEQVISLPIYPDLELDIVERICTLIKG